MRAPGNLDLVACIKRARRKTKALRRAFSPWTAEKPSSETFGGKNVQKGTARVPFFVYWRGPALLELGAVVPVPSVVPGTGIVALASGMPSPLPV